MKRGVFFIFFIIFFLVCFIFVINHDEQEKNMKNQQEKDIFINEENNEIDNFKDEDISIKTVEKTKEDIFLQDKNDDEILKIENLENGEEDIFYNFYNEQNFLKEEIDENFIQIINTQDQIDDLCVLNVVNNKSELSLYDYVFSECSDLGCKKFDLIEDKNGWYKVVFYGDFFGNKDTLYFKKIENEIFLANLECEIKEMDNFDNMLFKKLIE